MYNNRVLLSAIIMGQGYIFDTVKNGAEALEKMKAQAYEIVLTDRVMPVMDGLELTKEIKKLYPGQTVIGITGSSLKEQLDEWKEAGITFIITKPCTKENVKIVLGDYIGGGLCSSGSGV